LPDGDDSDRALADADHAARDLTDGDDAERELADCDDAHGDLTNGKKPRLVRIGGDDAHGTTVSPRNGHADLPPHAGEAQRQRAVGIATAKARAVPWK